MGRIGCTRATSGHAFAGFLDSAVCLYTDMLSSLQPGACSGLFAGLSLKRAETTFQKRQYTSALQDLGCALKWDPENLQCLQLRAEVCFIDQPITSQKPWCLHRQLVEYMCRVQSHIANGSQMPPAEPVSHDRQLDARYWHHLVLWVAKQ